MKHIFEEDLMQQFKPVLRGLQEHHSTEQLLRIFRIFDRYLAMSSKESQSVIMETFKSILEEWGFTEGSPAHLAYLEGLEEGEERGEKRGEKLGIERGWQASRDEAYFILYERGLTETAISELYGVSVEQVTAAIARHQQRLAS